MPERGSFVLPRAMLSEIDDPGNPEIDDTVAERAPSPHRGEESEQTSAGGDCWLSTLEKGHQVVLPAVGPLEAESVYSTLAIAARTAMPWVPPELCRLFPLTAEGGGIGPLEERWCGDDSAIHGPLAARP